MAGQKRTASYASTSTQLGPSQAKRHKSPTDSAVGLRDSSGDRRPRTFTQVWSSLFSNWVDYMTPSKAKGQRSRHQDPSPSMKQLKGNPVSHSESFVPQRNHGGTLAMLENLTLDSQHAAHGRDPTETEGGAYENGGSASNPVEVLDDDEDYEDLTGSGPHQNVRSEEEGAGEFEGVGEAEAGPSSRPHHISRSSSNPFGMVDTQHDLFTSSLISSGQSPGSALSADTPVTYDAQIASRFGNQSSHRITQSTSSTRHRPRIPPSQSTRQYSWTGNQRAVSVASSHSSRGSSGSRRSTGSTSKHERMARNGHVPNADPDEIRRRIERLMLNHEKLEQRARGDDRSEDEEDKVLKRVLEREYSRHAKEAVTIRPPRKSVPRSGDVSFLGSLTSRKAIDDITYAKPPTPFLPLSRREQGIRAREIAARASEPDILEIKKKYRELAAAREKEVQNRLKEKTKKLSPEQLGVVQNAFRNPAFKSPRCGNEQVQAVSLKRLHPGQWLDDEVINYYCSLINQRSEENPAKYGNVHYFNSFFFDKMQKQGYEGGRLKRWTKKVDIFAKDYILIPINRGNAHWVAAAINFKQSRLEYYDSMSGMIGRSAAQKAAEVLREYLEAEHLDKKGSPFTMELADPDENFKNPQQTNGDDCGVFTCQTLELVGRGRDVWAQNFDFKPEDMPYFRQLMVYEIAQGKLETRGD